jgi:hypothetical protein
MPVIYALLAHRTASTHARSALPGAPVVAAARRGARRS